MTSSKWNVDFARKEKWDIKADLCHTIQLMQNMEIPRLEVISE